MDLIVRKIQQSDAIKVYPVSDVHLGSILHDKDGWDRFCRMVEQEDAYLILGGDLINNNTQPVRCSCQAARAMQINRRH